MGQTPLIFGKEISLRSVINPQLQLGELDIGSIRIDPKSRDDIPQILLGLQHIYTTPEVRQAVFGILEEMLPEKKDSEEPGKADPSNGRPGMSQWQIFVLGVLRLGLNADDDRIQELANVNDSHRLKQYLQKFGLNFQNVSRNRQGNRAAFLIFVLCVTIDHGPSSIDGGPYGLPLSRKKL